MAVLFATVGCLTPDGLSYTSTLKKKYLGGRSFKDKKDLVSVGVLLEGNTELADFYTWWTDICLEGDENVLITLPFFGTSSEQEYRIINDIKTSRKSEVITVITLSLEKV